MRWRIEEPDTGAALEEGAVLVRDGRIEQFDGTVDTEAVLLIVDPLTAAEIRAGRLAPQRALILGRLRVEGSTEALMALTASLAGTAGGPTTVPTAEPMPGDAAV